MPTSIHRLHGRPGVGRPSARHWAQITGPSQWVQVNGSKSLGPSHWVQITGSPCCYTSSISSGVRKLGEGLIKSMVNY